MQENIQKFMQNKREHINAKLYSQIHRSQITITSIYVILALKTE
jgi:hypothetical protein